MLGVEQGSVSHLSETTQGCGCNDQVITAICMPIILLNVIFVLRYGLDLPFLSKRAFAALEVSEAASLTIGALSLPYLAYVVTKGPVDQTGQNPESFGSASSENKKSPPKDPTKPSTPAKPPSQGQNGILRLMQYATITNKNNVSARSYDRNGSGVNMNCFFHSLLTSMLFENESAVNPAERPWDPRDFFPPNATCTFQTASYEEYQFAANKLRKEFGDADLAEWQEGGFTTTNVGGQERIGFYEKWSLIKKAIYSIEHYLPRPVPLAPVGAFAHLQATQANYQRILQEINQERESFLTDRRFENPEFLKNFHQKVAELKKLFPTLKKWDVANNRYLENGIWEEYDANQYRWYYEHEGTHYLNKNDSYRDGHLEFVRNLCASLKPMSDGCIRQGENQENITVPPQLFNEHFSHLTPAEQKQKREWFSCLTQTLIENIEAHCIQAPEVNNDPFQVPSGFIKLETILAFLRKHREAGTQMSLLGCSRANLRFNREIVYFKNGQAPGHVNSSDRELRSFYIYNSGAHWTGVERENGRALADNCSDLLRQAEALPENNPQKAQLRTKAELR